MAFAIPFQPAPAEYPNHLADPQPERIALRPQPWLLLGLVLLCLVPRAWMAMRIPCVCPDGVIYINAAKALEAGDFRGAIREMSLNTYPFVLAALHRTGLEWELAAAIWGVVISSLVVLPLYGWIRRQFDDRVALVACLLYVVHPKFIEWSPEVMRDPTFWFLFTLTLYWLWRAIAEVRLGFFVAAGAAMTLSALTRVEGVFLLIPFVLWTFWRSLALHTARKRLLVGAVLCMSAFPALLATANLVWVGQRVGWTAPRLSPLARVQPWLQSVFGRETVDTPGDGIDPDSQMTVTRMAWTYFPRVTRGLSPVFAIVMLGGLWGWRRVWARRDHQPMFYVSLMILCGIWIQLWCDNNICPRYMLPIVLMASPFAALGLLAAITRLLRVAAWFGWNARGQHAVVATATLFVAVIGLADAMTSNIKYFRTRLAAADIGRWVRREFSASPMLVGPMGITPIANYYAYNGPFHVFRWEAGDDAILAIIQQSKADMVLLRPSKQLTPQRCAELVESVERLGFQPADRAILPPTCDDLRVLLRNPRATQAAYNSTKQP